MIYGLVLFIIVFLIGFNKRDGFVTSLLHALLGLPICVLMGLAIWLTLGLFIGSKLPQEAVVVKSEDIYALNNSGDDYLLKSTVDEQLVYSYVVKNSNGDKEIEEITVDNWKWFEDKNKCFITEDNNVVPHVEEVNYTFKNPVYVLFARINPDKGYYTIFIPKGSITEDYQINLK